MAQLLTPDTVPNRSLGTKVEPLTPLIDQVNGGVQLGSNLFHSFAEFNVLAGRGVYFTNPVGIKNILSRVTGSSPSNILGTLGVLGNANLFLINPNGIIFGSNANLDVGGSFVATTANAMRLGDTGLFSASEPATSNLLSINPSAFFFNASHQAIVNSSTATTTVMGVHTQGLQVPNGQSLLLVGGDVNLEGGSLLAPGGRVELAGVSGSGTVGLNINDKNLSLSFPDGLARADVLLTNSAEVRVLGGGGGSIAINAQNLSLAEGSSLQAGIARNQGAADAKAGNVDINVTNAIALSGSSFIENLVGTSAMGKGGDINIQAEVLSLTGGSDLVASTFGQGDVGNVNINVRERIAFDGEDQGSDFPSSGVYDRVETGAMGQGGNINLTTGLLSVTNGAVLSTSTDGAGRAGNVTINARNASFDGEGSIDAQPSGAFSSVKKHSVDQKGGDININTGSLFVTGGAKLIASTLGQGNAGDVNLNAQNQVVFDGEGKYSYLDLYSSAALSRVEFGAIGQGGNVKVTTGSLLLTNSAVLSTSIDGQGNAGSVTINARSTTFDGQSSSHGGSRQSSGAFSAVKANGIGQGGSINVTTESLSVTNGAALIASTLGDGNAGSVNINARDTVSFDGVGADFFSSGAYSRVEAGASGNGGNINITTGSLFMKNGAVLTSTTSGQGNAGNVIISARDLVLFDGEGNFNGQFRQSSGAFSAVRSGAMGQGGNVSITTGSLFVTNGAAGSVNIDARNTVSFDGVGSAFDRMHPDFSSSGAYSEVDPNGVGKGGSISIIAGSLSVTNGAVLTSSTNGQGDAGSVNINVRNTALFDGESNSINPDVGFRQYSGAFSSVKQHGLGQGGSVNVTADSLFLTSGAELITNTFGHGDAGTVKIQVNGPISFDGVGSNGFSSGAFSDVGGTAIGKGGDISVTTGSLSVTNGAQLSASTSGQGKGGTIQVNATQSLKLSGPGSSLSVSSVGQGAGAAGDLQMTAQSIQLDNQSQVIAETDSGQGGNIHLHDLDLLLMRHGSTISTTAGKQNANGDGGNITIDTPFIVAVPQENSDITANAYTGKGGRIDITAQGIFGTQFRPHLTPLSDITASSQFGVNGTVQINTPGIDPSRGLANLPTQPADASRQIAQGCPAGVGSASKFVVTGRGGLPPTPQEATRSESPLADLGTSISYKDHRAAVAVSTSSNPAVTPIVEAQGWIINSKGEVELVAEGPTANPSSWLTTNACHAP